MKNKKTNFSSFWEKVRFKYKLSFLNENTLETVFALRLSLLSGFLISAGIIVFFVFLTSIITLNTSLGNYLSGNKDSDMRQKMMENALKTDSLEQVIQLQSQYLNNLNAIMRGDPPETVTQQPIETTSIKIEDLTYSKEMSKFIKEIEEEERYNLNVLASASSLPENLIFYRPVRGLISNHFNLQEKHYGIDIAATPKESVLATMKGTIIFVGFDANAGYIIQVQHTNGFISVYKHNAMLLKKQGDAVEAGEAIAFVGNTGSLSTGNHLHFELWYGGKPVNPEDFIVL
jgi:murein DD-endopeptidase MepM/ murein hydrolase activator NlpD